MNSLSNLFTLAISLSVKGDQKDADCLTTCNQGQGGTILGCLSSCLNLDQLASLKS